MKQMRDTAAKHNVKLVSFIHGEYQATGAPLDVEAFNAEMEMTALTNANISKRILEHTKQGKTVKEALDAVLGPGTFDKVASDIYDALKVTPTEWQCDNCAHVNEKFDARCDDCGVEKP